MLKFMSAQRAVNQSRGKFPEQSRVTSVRGSLGGCGSALERHRSRLAALALPGQPLTTLPQPPAALAQQLAPVAAGAETRGGRALLDLPFPPYRTRMTAGCAPRGRLEHVQRSLQRTPLLFLSANESAACPSLQVTPLCKTRLLPL